MRWLAAVLVFAALPQQPARGNGQAQPRPKIVSQASPAMADFLTRVQGYASLQRKVAERVGPLDPTKSPAEIAAREKALRESLLAARADAKRGDLFAPGPAALFKTLIRNEFAQRSKLAIRNREDSQDELPNFTPVVNQIYPTAYPLATFPPGVLRQLPPLPKPLEYRFVQSFLILRDTEANLIVDVLPDAAPALK